MVHVGKYTIHGCYGIANQPIGASFYTLLDAIWSQQAAQSIYREKLRLAWCETLPWK